MNQWPWGQGASSGHPVGPEAFLRLQLEVEASVTCTFDRADLSHAQVALLHGTLPGSPLGEASQGPQVALLPEG